MLFAALLALMAPGTAAAARAVEGRLLVTWDGGVRKPDRARARAAVAGERLVRTDRALGLQVLRVAPGQAAAVARRLRAERGVRTVERDVLRTPSHVDCQGNPVCVLPGDPLFGAQWGLQNDSGTSHRSPGARAGADIAAPLAWAQGKGAGTRIAIIDTGVDEAHEDLAGRVVAGWAAGGGSDRSDGVGHGTHVAGIAAAVPGNGRGGAGVAWSSTLINLKANVGADTSFPCSAISTAVRQAADLGAKVINMSLGGPTPCSAERTAIAYAQSRDALVVAAAGNEGSTTVQYPAAFDGVIAVGATTNADEPAPFSNRGADWVDIAAPGVDILSTVPGSQYGYLSGTSMAAPFVSGAAALIWSSVPDANGNGRTAEEVAARLLTSADRVTGSGTLWASGRLNVCRALAGAADRCPPTAAPSSPAPAPSPAPAAPAATPSAAPRLAKAKALSLARSALSARYGREWRARRAARVTCKATARSSSRCTVSWRTARFRYRGRVEVRLRVKGTPHTKVAVARRRR